MPALRLYNSLTRRKESFEPIDPDHVRLYACGPTVYNYAHIGNARMAVVFDLLVRVLRRTYPQVTYVSNITDIDDKIIAAARETGDPVEAITKKYADIYNRDMTALGVAAPDVQPRATEAENLEAMITLIGQLIEKGHAYEAEGHVLFDVPSFKAYGRLSGRSRDEQVAGARVEIAPYKKDPADFVLWKPSSGDEPGWESLWSFGRPGWHIECSAMAEKHLGLPFDIHGGGADLKFPHHENEIAQSCCAHSYENDVAQFARYWVHNGFVTVEGEKMAKSEGNVRLVHDLLEKYDGEVLRLALLSAHYRQPLDWSQNKLEQSKNALDAMYRTLYDLRDIEVSQPSHEDHQLVYLMESLCDDLNTPNAITVARSIGIHAAKDKTPEAKQSLLFAGEMLGILQKDPVEWLGYGQAGDSDPEEIEKLLQERQDARTVKDFARADKIRDELQAKGILIEDTPDGTKWRRA